MLFPPFLILQPPPVESSLDLSTLPKLEEFYSSLIQSQQSAEGSQPEPSCIQTPAKPVQLSTAALSASPMALDSAEKHSGSGSFTYNRQILLKTFLYLFQNITWKIADFSVCLKYLLGSVHFYFATPLFFFLQFGWGESVLHTVEFSSF